MPKLNKRKIFAPEVQFLAFPDHYVNVTGLITRANAIAMKQTDAEVFGTREVIKRGTLVHIGEDGAVVAPSAENKANGIVFNTIFLDEYDDVDTHINLTVLVHGFVRKDRLVGDATLLESGLIFVLNQ